MTKGVTFWLLNPWFKEYFRQFLFISLYNADVITYLITFISFSKNLWYLVYYVSECLYLVTLITWSWWKSIMWKTDVTYVLSVHLHEVHFVFVFFFVAKYHTQELFLILNRTRQISTYEWGQLLGSIFANKKNRVEDTMRHYKKHLEDDEGHMYMIK